MEDPDIDLLAELIADSIDRARSSGKLYSAPSPSYAKSIVIDDLLPESVIGEIPPIGKDARFFDIVSLAESKSATIDVASLPKIVQQIILAFLSDTVAGAVSGITGRDGLTSDHNLYNGGLTIMGPGDYMMQHVDRSHDQHGARRREVVALYYLTTLPQEEGGQLGLWPDDQATPPILIPCVRNRLVLIGITSAGWHSVEQVAGATPRLSITTPYYSGVDVGAGLNLTKFRAGQGKPLAGVRLRLGYGVRRVGAWLGLRRLFPARHSLNDPPTQSGQSRTR